MRTYRVRREWTVVMESWIEVQAETPEAAAEIALGDDDYDNQRIADDSDGPTEIGRVVEVMTNGLAACRRCCDTCGCVGQPHYFVTSLDGEPLCVDCA